VRQLLSLDRTDEAAREALTRLLEKAHRWDELAQVIEQEAIDESDIEKRIILEKKQLRFTSRNEAISAAPRMHGRGYVGSRLRMMTPY